MSKHIQGATISDAWRQMLVSVAEQPDLRERLLFVTIDDPLAKDDPDVRGPLDLILTPSNDEPNVQSVETVASTIFFSDLYPDPGVRWDPVENGLTMPLTESNERVQAAAVALYHRYAYVYPALRQAHPENTKGTYFGRMIGWPGHAGSDLDALGPVNQLQDRIVQLRRQHGQKRPKLTFNASGLVLSNTAAAGMPEATSGAEGGADDDLTVNVLRPTDGRTRSFPCLTHVDIGVHNGLVNLVAVYRLQQVITKAYGNMLGLARLQAFIAQQTGYGVGELGIHATMASLRDEPYGVSGVRRLRDDITHQSLFLA